MKKTIIISVVILILSIGLYSCAFGECDLSLKSISIFGEELEQFSPDVLEYEFLYDPGVGIPSQSHISYVKADSSAKVSISVDKNVIKIVVFDKPGGNRKEYKINMKVMDGVETSAEIVNKNGAKGVLTLISDDGNQRTSDFFYTVVANEYPAFKVTIALPTKNIASLNTTADGKAFLFDDNGNYVLTVKNNSYVSSIEGSPFKSGACATMVDFWKKVTDTGAIEIASHSHTHGESWPMNDDVVYNSDGVTVKYPAGSVLKEINASAQILRELIGQETPFILRPGGTFWNNADRAYFDALILQENTFIGMRGSNGAPPFVGATSANGAKLNTPDKFKNTTGRLGIATILVRSYEAAYDSSGKAFATTSASSKDDILAAGVSAWEQYVDYAIQYGQWASIGFHSVVSDDSTASGYAVYDSQVKALMDYVQPLVDSGELWLPSFAEAAKYYFEWSSAELSAITHGTDRVEVTLTDAEEDARFDEPLTLKITVPTEWKTAQVESYGETVDIEIHVDDDGTHFVYANIIPGDGVSVVREK